MYGSASLLCEGGNVGWSMEDLLTPSLGLHQPHFTELLSKGNRIHFCFCPNSVKANKSDVGVRQGSVTMGFCSKFYHFSSHCL